MTNVEMAQRTLQWLLENPEHHKQSNWQCGTKMCVAGAAIMLNAMDEQQLTKAANGDHRRFGRLWAKTVTTGSRTGCWQDEGRLGGLILGLTNKQCSRLFRGDQSNDQALAYLKELINEAESETT